MKTNYEKCKWVSLFLAVLGVIAIVVGMSGCGGADGNDGVDGKPGLNGKDAPVKPTSAYTFGSNTNCQQVYTGYSARKPSSHSSDLKLYATTNCSGSVLTTLKSTGNDVYESTTFRATLEGTNATGLTLYVGGK